MMSNQSSQKTFSQRQLRVGELVKQNLGELFIRNEAKIPKINSKLITVTEVRMTPDLKTARVYVIPLGCLLYTSPSPRDGTKSRMPSSA